MTTIGENGLSRRRMLQMSGMFGIGAAGAMLAGCSGSGNGEPDPAPAPSTITLEVYDPSGSIEVTQTFTPRLDTLEGKTIGFVADEAWEDDRTFAMIKDYLEKTYHCTVYWYDNWPKGIADITKVNNGIAEKMKAVGVDAAIIGNAG